MKAGDLNAFQVQYFGWILYHYREIAKQTSKMVGMGIVQSN